MLVIKIASLRCSNNSTKVWGMLVELCKIFFCFRKTYAYRSLLNKLLAKKELTDTNYENDKKNHC